MSIDQASTPQAQAAAPLPVEKTTIRAIHWRILPFLMVCYFVAFIDRVNVGFAALQMNRDLGLTAAMFGFGASLFFVAYFLFEVPSNLALIRFGARRWIARIMITWGIISAGMAFVPDATWFYAMRFALGAAEAGFFPGVILYLTFWYPTQYRARVIALFMVAIPLSSFLGSPLSGLLLGLDGLNGLKGWQWMYLVEGLPAVFLGLACLGILKDRPEEAGWLSGEQKSWLSAKLASEQTGVKTVAHEGVWGVMFNRHVLAGALIYGGSTGASACLSIWLPQILKSYGLSNFETGLVNAIPFGIASLFMVLWGRNSDRTGERLWHTILPLAAIAISLGFIGATSGLWLAVSLFTVAVSATYAVKGPFWALSTEWMSGRAAAVGIAQINAIGGLWSGLSTYLLGQIKGTTGSYALGLTPLIAMTAIGSVLTLLMARKTNP